MSGEEGDRNMNYEQFVESYMKELNIRLKPEGVEISRSAFHKVNGDKDGLSFHYPDSDTAPTMYLRDKYQLCKKEGYSVKEIADGTISALNTIRKEVINVPPLNMTTAKDNLYTVVINADENKELLKTTPHERVMDLAIIPRFRIGEEASFIVTNDVCHHLQMTSHEVMDIARQNTSKEVFECINMSDMMREMMTSEGVTQEYIDEILDFNEDRCPIYVMTNEERLDGAVALTQPVAMDAAYQKLKEDYPEMESMYVIASSRHELLLMPDSKVDNVDNLKSMHQEVQDLAVRKEDKLTENVYRFDGRIKQMSIADKPTLMSGMEKDKVVIRANGKSH